MSKQLNNLSKHMAAFEQFHILSSFNSIIKKFPLTKNNKNFNHKKSNELPSNVLRAFANTTKDIVPTSGSYIDDILNIQEEDILKFSNNDQVLIEDKNGKLQSRVFLHFVPSRGKALVECSDHSYAEYVDVKSLIKYEQNDNASIKYSASSNFEKKQLAEIDFFGQNCKFEIEKELEDDKVLLKHLSLNIRLAVKKNKIISISSPEKPPFSQGEIVYASIGGIKKLFKFDHTAVNNKACLKDFISGYIFITSLDKISRYN